MQPTAHLFPRNAQRALADKTLQAALGRATGRFLHHRAEAVAAFPGFGETRERASEIKRQTLAQLEHHLGRFIEEATRRGAVVHVARDAAQAREIAARIAKEEGVTLAVKSKSMASEETSFNVALQGAGDP